MAGIAQRAVDSATRQAEPAPGRGATISRPIGVVVGLSVPVAMLLGESPGAPAIPLAVVGAALVLGTVRIPRFWRVVGRGLLAGGIAGMLLLGPGYRAAMRLVALLEPSRAPEFTLAGTLFVVVGIGLVVGAVTTAWTTLLARALQLRRSVGVGLLTIATLGLLFADSAVLEELRELGAGPWMNVPLFAGITLAFAAVADRWARPVAGRGHDLGDDHTATVGPVMMEGDRAGRSA